MDSNNSPFPAEGAMRRAFEQHPFRHAFRLRAATVAVLGPSLGRHLPPTRAARPARSRGAFFGSHWRARLGRWVRSAAFIAVATLTVAASAHFAQPAFDAAAINGNTGPELLASTARAPLFLTAPGR